MRKLRDRTSFSVFTASSLCKFKDLRARNIDKSLVKHVFCDICDVFFSFYDKIVVADVRGRTIGHYRKNVVENRFFAKIAVFAKILQISVFCDFIKNIAVFLDILLCNRIAASWWIFAFPFRCPVSAFVFTHKFFWSPSSFHKANS